MNVNDLVKKILTGKSVRQAVLESVDNQTVQMAVKHAERFKGNIIDLDNHKIIIPFSSGVTEQDLMEPGMLGEWFKSNGFDISFRNGDVEYQTKGNFNTASMRKEKGHTAYLRNRLIMTAIW